MLNAIKLKLALNAFNNFKMKSVAGGEGRFSMKGFKFKYKALHLSIGELSFSYNFPTGVTSLNEGMLEYKDTNASVELTIKELSIEENGGSSSIDYLELGSAVEIKEFLMSLPVNEIAELITIS